MAVTMSHSAFEAQQPFTEDTMEISSDIGHGDGDIDIDLEADYDQQENGEEDRMLEDTTDEAYSFGASQPAAEQSPDDVMDDDLIDYSDDEPEAEMEDLTVVQEEPAVQEDDEELLDFSDLEGNAETQYETHGDDAEGSASAMPPIGDAGTVTGLSSTIQHEIAEQDEGSTQATQAQAALNLGPAVRDVHAESEGATAVEDATVDATDTAVEASSASINLPSGDHEKTEEANEVERSQALNETALHHDESHEGLGDVGNPSEHPVGVPQSENVDVGNSADAPVSADQSEDAYRQDKNDEPQRAAVGRHGSLTVTGLHPTIVRYQGSDVHLFPSGVPGSFEQYFLENETLVNASIGEMLQACRDVLGESISENDELAMSVEQLGLYISEDSTPAFSTSFAEILNVYVQLHAYDTPEQAPPLLISLKTRTRFTHRLTLLNQLVAEGKGLSEVPPAIALEYESGDAEEDPEFVEHSLSDEEPVEIMEEYQEGGVDPQDELEADGNTEHDNTETNHPNDKAAYEEETATEEDVTEPNTAIEPEAAEDHEHDISRHAENDEIYIPDDEGLSIAKPTTSDGESRQISDEHVVDNPQPHGTASITNYHPEDETSNEGPRKSSDEETEIEANEDEIAPDTESEALVTGTQDQLGEVDNEDILDDDATVQQLDEAIDAEIEQAFDDADQHGDNSLLHTEHPEINVDTDDSTGDQAAATEATEQSIKSMTNLHTEKNHIQHDEGLANALTQEHDESTPKTGLDHDNHPTNAVDVAALENIDPVSHDDLDFIDFDEDEIDQEQAPSLSVDTKVSGKSSPNPKRTWSERDTESHLDSNEQDSKRSRS